MFPTVCVGSLINYERDFFKTSWGVAGEKNKAHSGKSL